MSAPTPAPGDDRPREGYYPDPSIPGYVRYWNGASWVPGTSRPAPTDGRPLTPPAGSGQPWPSHAPDTPAQTPGAADPGPDPGQSPPGHAHPAAPPAPGQAPGGTPGWATPGQAPARGAAGAPGWTAPEPAAGQGVAAGPQPSGPPVPSQAGPGGPQSPAPGLPPVAGPVHAPGAGTGFGAPPAPSAPSAPHAAPAAPAAPAVPAVPAVPAAPAAPVSPGSPAGSPSAPAGSFGPAPGSGQGGAPGPSPVETTGPHFFDEDPDARQPSPGDAQHGSRPEPAAAWGADRARQAGFGNEQDRRVSWGSPSGADPRLPADAPAAEPDARTPPAAGAGATPDGTFVFRRPGAAEPGPAGSAAPVADEGTMTFRAVPPRTGGQPGAPAGPGFGAGKAAADRAAAAQAQALPAQAQAQPQAAPAPTVPPQPDAPGPVAASGTPVTSGPGGGQHSWAQQVHRLAGEDGEQPVLPWKPPVEDVFQAAARRQSEARPASLGKRLAARLVDTVVLAAVTGAAAVPLGTRAVDHVDEKIDAARLSGETVTVWLLDGTTALYLGVVLAVLLLFGVVYEALPTARWGRTLGKRLFGLEVRDIEGHEPPGFGAALRRWLVYSVPGLLVVGVVGVVWCLFDRPWHQCWHDKAAHTFVAG
ncbi:RDD family protein [Streptomyces griseoviridis]